MLTVELSAVEGAALLYIGVVQSGRARSHPPKRSYWQPSKVAWPSGKFLDHGEEDWTKDDTL
jgi:hypothetical protein